MTEIQHDLMIQKIYDLVDSHYQGDEQNDELIRELCEAFQTICPVTV